MTAAQAPRMMLCRSSRVHQAAAMPCPDQAAYGRTWICPTLKQTSSGADFIDIDPHARVSAPLTEQSLSLPKPAFGGASASLLGRLKSQAYQIKSVCGLQERRWCRCLCLGRRTRMGGPSWAPRRSPRSWPSGWRAPSASSPFLCTASGGPPCLARYSPFTFHKRC